MAKKHTYKHIKQQIENVNGYKLLSNDYKNCLTKIKVQCDKGHKYKVSYKDFQQGKRCPDCAGNVKHTYEFVKEQIESVEGYKLLSNCYKNAHTKLKVQCNKGHEYKVIWNNFKQGHRCPICDAEKQSSKTEKEIFKIVKRLLPSENIVENNRTQIVSSLTNRNLELDIWIPELNKAIEFNGEYWHSLEEVKIRDIEKVKQCKKKGIDLLVIQERNWLNNKSKFIERLKLWCNN